MADLCFLSHAQRDTSLARHLAEMITRVSLKHIDIWYSSDESGTGGIGAGERWLDTIRDRLRRSRAILALLTPTSLQRPWIYFESGFGAANADLEVIPVAVGLQDLTSIPMPLAMYQAFQLSDLRSIEKVLGKLLPKFEEHFDREMAQSPMMNLVTAIGRHLADATDSSEVVEPPDALSQL